MPYGKGPPTDPTTHKFAARALDDTGADGITFIDDERWPLERVLFVLAGTMTLLSAVLAVTVSNWFLLLTGFVGLNQWLYVVARACPASIALRRACGLRSAIYPNRELAVAGPDGVTG
jgi:hypothetical protein